MVDVSICSSLNVSFCRNISDKHLVLLPLNNTGFDECRVTYYSSGFSISIYFFPHDTFC